MAMVFGNQQDWNGGGGQYARCHRTKDRGQESAPSVRPHDDDIGSARFDHVDDLRRRLTNARVFCHGTMCCLQQRANGVKGVFGCLVCPLIDLNLRKICLGPAANFGKHVH
ncbi:protein of unknown function (plasmid) [Cupriavidus neocaledonicus]|uniref:Uncharacterized protein n=1 Tax=Cupriavidus neocaledonicus TaxID=1040979 RepID=A0A375HPR8_9BURK|nr:protein of unknown function [Cupriavidus neocaledonicus]